jgi:hypothetical protein
MRSMQVRATQLQDATDARLEPLRVRSRELRLRISDLQAHEQQINGLRMQSPATSPDRASLDKQWMDVRHSLTATTLELEAVGDRMTDLRNQRDQAVRDQAQREQAQIAALPPMTSAAQRPAVEVPGLANMGPAILVLFIAPVLLILVYRFLTRRSAPPAPFTLGEVSARSVELGLEASTRFQRLEQTVESIAMEVERIAEGQRFTTAILAERLTPSTGMRAQVTPPQSQDAVTPN